MIFYFEKTKKVDLPLSAIGKGYGDHILNIDWSKQDIIPLDEETRKTILPADWDNPEDEGLYDDLV